jgi:hypothetical protein
MTEYLNSDLVKEQLHILPETNWMPCNDLKYQRSVFGSFWIMNELINSGYKLLVYSGNSD